MIKLGTRNFPPGGKMSFFSSFILFLWVDSGALGSLGYSQRSFYNYITVLLYNSSSSALCFTLYLWGDICAKIWYNFRDPFTKSRNKLTKSRDVFD